MKSFASPSATLALVVCSGLSALAAGQPFEPLDQARSVDAFVIVPPCLGKDFASDAASDFGPFVSQVTAELPCDVATGVATAGQDSSIGASSAVGSGQAFSESASVVPDQIHAIADSLFEATFEVTSASPFALSGALTAETSDDPIVVLAGAVLSLVAEDGTEIVEHTLTPGPGGKAALLVVEASGTLEPGVYTLRALAAAVIDNESPPSRTASASYEFFFELTGEPCPADVTDDGSVDIDDLVAVVLAWGPCPSGPCPEDVTGDGDVTVDDLVAVILAWGAAGPCP